MAEVYLPPPDRIDEEGSAYWLDSTGERVYAVAGSVYAPEHGADKSLTSIEMDAAIRLAAVRYAQEQRKAKDKEKGIKL